MSEVRLTGQERLDLADAVFLHDGEEWLETTYAAVEAIIAARMAAVEALADEWERHPYALISGTPIARLRAALDGQAAEDIWARNAAIFKHEAETPMRGHEATCCARAALGGER